MPNALILPTMLFKDENITLINGICLFAASSRNSGSASDIAPKAQ